MYILIFNNKYNDNFGLSGVFESLKEVETRIKSLQVNPENNLKFIDYKDNLKIKIVNSDDLLEWLEKELNKYCSIAIEGDNNIFNINILNDIKRI